MTHGTNLQHLDLDLANMSTVQLGVINDKYNEQLKTIAETNKHGRF